MHLEESQQNARDSQVVACIYAPKIPWLTECQLIWILVNHGPPDPMQRPLSHDDDLNQALPSTNHAMLIVDLSRALRHSTISPF